LLHILAGVEVLETGSLGGRFAPSGGG